MILKINEEFRLFYPMRQAKIFNIYELAYLSRIPYRDLIKVYDNKVDRIHPRRVKRLCETLDCTERDLIGEKDDRTILRNRPYKLHHAQGDGLVYFIRALSGNLEGLTKIGYTRDMQGRLAKIYQDLKIEMEVTYYIATSDVVTLEQTLHNVFKAKRVTGEWFDLSDEDIELVKA
ncbi:GIY-YIG nuclease family protein [Priestia flexa]|uniref:GIY-YIG nuclease family protein n=1 Tax=Priestia flexa TaxID=86664 RepID=UPI001F4D2C41|nr:GIY-YIG nuclease family protein [Priestia flexa]